MSSEIVISIVRRGVAEVTKNGSMAYLTFIHTMIILLTFFSIVPQKSDGEKYPGVNISPFVPRNEGKRF